MRGSVNASTRSWARRVSPAAGSTGISARRQPSSPRRSPRSTASSGSFGGGRSRTRDALRREALGIVGDYLHPDHRDEVGQGCHLAALAADVARTGRPAQRAYETAVRALADELGRGLDRPQPLDPRALATIALCVGGRSVARAVDDETLATAVLQAAERVAREQLLGSP